MKKWISKDENQVLMGALIIIAFGFVAAHGHDVKQRNTPINKNYKYQLPFIPQKTEPAQE